MCEISIIFKNLLNKIIHTLLINLTELYGSTNLQIIFYEKVNGFPSDSIL